MQFYLVIGVFPVCLMLKAHRKFFHVLSVVSLPLCVLLLTVPTVCHIHTLSGKVSNKMFHLSKSSVFSGLHLKSNQLGLRLAWWVYGIVGCARTRRSRHTDHIPDVVLAHSHGERRDWVLHVSVICKNQFLIKVEFRNKLCAFYSSKSFCVFLKLSILCAIISAPAQTVRLTRRG